jgi:ABC-2 type transport system ATP-binding protein
VIEVRDLVVEFGDLRAVDGLSISVPAGTSTALVGRNGAGKSTTMRAMAGVLPPTRGTLMIDGVDARSDPAAAKERLGYCPDVGGLIPRATPWEHLQLSATLRGLSDGWQTRASDLLERFDLTAAADRITAGFSHGMGRRTSVILAVFHQPRVVLLDEPFDGVDPLGVDATLSVIEELRAAGSSVVVSTHLLDLAVQACQQASVLVDGRAVEHGPARALAGAEGAGHYRTLLATPREP